MVKRYKVNLVGNWESRLEVEGRRKRLIIYAKGTHSKLLPVVQTLCWALDSDVLPPSSPLFHQLPDNYLLQPCDPQRSGVVEMVQGIQTSV